MILDQSTKVKKGQTSGAKKRLCPIGESRLLRCMARPPGIEPRSQAPEACVISIGPRAHVVNDNSENHYRIHGMKKQVCGEKKLRVTDGNAADGGAAADLRRSGRAINGTWFR
jgi:hypothetical protein